MRARFLLLTLGLVACGADDQVAGPGARVAPPPSAAPLQPIDPPSGPGAMAPNLALASGGVVLTWLEPDDPGSRETFRLRAARWDGARWGSPADAAAGGSFFANWADLPAAAEAPEGFLVTHWLEKLGEDTYAYGVALAGSEDGGATWQRRGWLHGDTSETEHGFVSFVPVAGGVRAFWLDGRAMAADPPGPMQLRTRLVAAADLLPSTLLDDRVCECCATDAALTADGPIVAYRDRSGDEVRDVAIVRAEDGGWSAPAVVSADGWEIHGCPVNGPALAADGSSVALAWFTAAGGEPRVKLAFSSDAGRSFGTPLTVDGDRPLGRVDVALDPQGDAWVSWMAETGDGGEIRLRRFAASGEAGELEVVARTTAQRSAGVPRMLAWGGRLVLAWVEDAEPSRLAMAARPLD